MHRTFGFECKRRRLRSNVAFDVRLGVYRWEIPKGVLLRPLLALAGCVRRCTIGQARLERPGFVDPDVRALHVLRSVAQAAEIRADIPGTELPTACTAVCYHG